MLFQSIFNYAFMYDLQLVQFCNSVEANTMTKIFQLAGANVGGHDYNGILEIHLSA